jgi:hypothetical protein
MMRGGIYLGIIIAFSVVIGAISNEIGLTNNAIPTPGSPPEPGGGPLASIFGPLKYVWDAATAFFAIITYQVEGVPALISTLMLGTIGVSVVWMILGLIRGGK